jgi:two-component system response regulator
MSVLAPVDVLVVEDPKHNPELTLFALNGHADIKSALVNDGTAAQQFLAHCSIPPKVILLDMQLPDMDGIELLRLIRSDERTKALPVFMLTKAADQKRKTEARGLGVNGYIPKTTEVQLLADHLTIFRHLIVRDRAKVKNESDEITHLTN